MDIVFCDLDPRLAEVAPVALHAVGLEARVATGDVTRLSCDALACSADAFGGLGAVADTYRERMPGVEAAIRAAIAERRHRELLIGEALAVATQQRPIRYLIVAPVMRLPSAIGDATAVFLAARAAMAEAIRLGVDSIAFPAMGAGTGQIPFETSALAMAAGIAAAQGRPATFPAFHPFHVP